MSDLGQLLKKARTQKGYTLDELQDMTKIRKRYLEAIEEGNYKVLPGNFYVRAFIKSYSEAVGLEPDEVLRLYRSAIPETDPEPVIDPIRRRTKPPSSSDKMSKWASALLVIAFPLLIIGVIYYYVWNNSDGQESLDPTIPLTNNQTETTNQEPITNANNEPEPLPEPEPEPVPEMELSLVKSDRSVDYYLIKNATQLVVEVQVVGDRCWMAIQNDNSKGTYVEENLNLLRDDERQWTFDGSVYMNFGRANAIKVKINGTEINMGELANPRKLQLDFEPLTETSAT